jgi:hypothetical protein
VRNANGQKLAYVYFEDEPGRQAAAKLLRFSPASKQHTPNKLGSANEVQAVAVSTRAGLVTWPRKTTKSTRRNAIDEDASEG